MLAPAVCSPAGVRGAPGLRQSRPSPAHCDGPSPSGRTAAATALLVARRGGGARARRSVLARNLWTDVKPAEARDSPFRELDLLDLWDGTGRTRVRQHVNPLRSEYTRPAAPPDWAALYDDPSLPLVVDIGSGYGRFLLLLQRNNAQRPVNCLGVEIRRPLVDRANEWASRLGVGRRVAYVFANATVSLRGILDTYPGPLEEAFVQFPDPHFKRRHHKRRVVQRELVEALGSKMVPGGRVLLQSDVEEVAAAMRDAFEEHGRAFFDLSLLHAEAGRAFFTNTAAAAAAAAATTAAAAAAAPPPPAPQRERPEEQRGTRRPQQDANGHAQEEGAGSHAAAGASGLHASGDSGAAGVATANVAAPPPDYAAAAALAARRALLSAATSALAVREAEAIARAEAAGQNSASARHGGAGARGDGVLQQQEAAAREYESEGGEGEGEDSGPGGAGEAGWRVASGAGGGALGPAAEGEAHDRQSAPVFEWAHGGWLVANPVGTPTEREHYVRQQGMPVFRVLLVARGSGGLRHQHVRSP